VRSLFSIDFKPTIYMALLVVVVLLLLVLLRVPLTSGALMQHAL
jgi:hypothetical protein